MLREFRIQINKPPVEVFQFLCSKDTYKQQDGSPVLLLQKTTTGPLDVGTRYREVVQMAPFVKSQILSEITRYEPYSVLEEKWAGNGMKGILTYFFHQIGQGTELIQHVIIETHWLLRPFNTIISKTYSKAAQYRLEVIKMVLETGQSPDIQKIKWWHFSKIGKR
jgi:uncharacterized protein YndB with AHSA1/START domain